MSKQEIFLRDYRPPDYLLDSAELEFTLGEDVTVVRSMLSLRRNGAHERPVVLDGECLQLESVKMNGRVVDVADLQLTDDRLTIPNTFEKFKLELEVRIRPQENTTLSGLYCSSGNFCTQCEAEGFRRITFFPDRPDVLTRYKTIINADKDKYPVLLSNGNLIDTEALDNGRHRAVWEDPFPKPSYLFALVAGDLAYIQDRFVTRSGRVIDLYIYTQHHNIDKCDHAMHSLQKAMRWDEEEYGREYDLDRYMIVAVDDFNMGAMENKGLNIFNSKYVLARPETATDADYDTIQGIIAHEYFHNWSGNRVTCRDWFQLSLKEGFTVFRDQEFSADMGSRGVHRIEDVNVLRTHQFPEDSGPMSHAVRPQSYQEINNFYTVTVYNKGAEVVRMLHRLVGPDGFRRGTDRYFDTFDGKAVTTDDFVTCIEQENEIDLTQFKNWYDQAGTPRLKLGTNYDPVSKTYSLDVEQSCPPTPGQDHKKPFHLPLSISLLDAEGGHLPLDRKGSAHQVLQIREPKQTFTFADIPSKPVLSALREFSAPVKLEINYSADELYFLLVHDTDPFARWEAATRISTRLILDLVTAHQTGKPLEVEESFVRAFEMLLTSGGEDLALLSLLLKLPSETYVSEFLDIIDPDAVYLSIAYVKKVLGSSLADTWHAVYTRYCDESYEMGTVPAGRRSLKNTCLDYLVSTEDPTARHMARNQYRSADNMTDKMAALSALNNHPGVERDESLNEFYAEWKRDNLVVDKWLMLQATSRQPDTLSQVRLLTTHESFNLHNPNKVHALLGAFAHGNSVRFHQADGAGYKFIAEYVMELDSLNPQIASRLATAFNRWRRFDDSRQKLIETELQRILKQPGLSGDVEEIVGKALEQECRR